MSALGWRAACAVAVCVASFSARDAFAEDAASARTTKRWYGWEVLIANGAADLATVAGLVQMASGELDGGFFTATTTPLWRSTGSLFVELVGHNKLTGVAWSLANFGVPLLGAFTLGYAVSGHGPQPGQPLDPEFAKAWAGGMLLGGSIVTAIEVSVAFEDVAAAPRVMVQVGPTSASLSIPF